MKTAHSFYAVGMLAVASLAALVLAPDSMAAINLRILHVEDTGNQTVLALDEALVVRCPGFEQALERAARDGEVLLQRRSSFACPVHVLLGDEWDHRQVAAWNGTYYRFESELG